MLDSVKRQKYGCKHSLYVLTYGMGNWGQNHEMQLNAYNYPWEAGASNISCSEMCL